MRIIFLGTGSGAPSKRRNVSSLAVHFIQTGAMWLFDCGEGTQQQILKSPVKLNRLEKIFITHLHGDHIFGLPGLLASRSMQDASLNPITIFGPPGLSDFIDSAFRVSRMHLSYRVHFEAIQPGLVLSNDDFTVDCMMLEHGGSDNLSFRLQEHDRPGSLDAETIAKLGVKPGPIYGRLKNGETITLDDGRIINGSEFIGPPHKGRKIVISGDSKADSRIVEFAQNADILIHEATFSGEDLDLARIAGHTTSTQAAEFARDAGVKKLILTHISARYDSDVTPLYAEAKRIFDNTTIAEDGLILDF